MKILRNRLKLTLLITIFLFPALIFGQNPKSIIKDFNNDGYKDTLKTYYDGGSGFGGTYLSLINGKTKEIFELDDFGCFCDIKKIILIPPKLMQLRNKPFLEAIKKELLPARRNFPDASLQWLISANINNKKLSNNSYYDLFIKTPPQWIPGKIELPNTYYIDVSGDTLQKLYFADNEKPTWYNPKKNKGWLVYYAHNHYQNQKGNSLVLVDASTKYKVFRTFHGVVVTKGNLHNWVFVTDYQLTGAPEKLRWKSIEDVVLIDKYLILQLINSEAFSNPIFIIDIEKGFTGRLRCNDDFFKSYRIDKENFIVESNKGTKTYKLQKLFSELSKQ